MAMARMRRACLASAVRAASARNREILGSWRVISIADMLPAPRIIDVPHRVTFADGWESHGSQVLGRLVSPLNWSGFHIRGRDAHCWAPPAQIRANPIRALGSYLGCLTAKRTLGHG